MVNQIDKKFTWVIRNYSSLPSDIISSDHFVIGGCKWRLCAYPKGRNKPNYLSLFLQVADYESLPPGWRIHARYLLFVVNQNPQKHSKLEERRVWFDHNNPHRYSLPCLPLSTLHAKDGGYIVNNEVKIVAEVEVLEVIGKLYIVAEPVTAIPPVKKVKVENDCTVDTSSVKSSIDVSGFQVLPSQVDFVRRIFEKHPDIASEFRPKNPSVKTAYMNVLLSLIEILRQSPQEMSKDDLAYAHGLLVPTKDAGFKVDWLEKKLNEVSENKEKEEAYQTRMEEIEQELEDLKAKVLATRAPLTLDDCF